MKTYKFLVKLRRNFLTGVLIFMPVTVSVYLVYITLTKITDFFIRYFPHVYQVNFQNIILFRIITLFLLIGFIILLSIFARNLIGKKIYRFMEFLFLKIPIINRIYTGLKQIFEGYAKLISEENQTMISKVCLVPFATDTSYAIGFITSKTIDDVRKFSDEKYLSILIPSTPAPLAGFYVMVPEKDIIALDMSVHDALILAASGGIVNPPFQVKPGGYAPSMDNND